ncbi:autophagy-related protein 2 isoform X1 [Zea mays]|uniref:Autophagy-related protein 2 n=5 Tax=Zea mays TaxID=4577 RepID=A0A1D6LWL0_MAIZE|nr:autophagy-related protein 2 isoform X1 [Zea mays]XP_008649298.1 autophagy-related protein 2 isoform X1 [Zea mays]AQK83599.1 Retrovirus-related Pol polyprotein LINE-1 [Zea mays]AQK83601.1 Retrovirus-related Pol polyprotein LINE-1 [Zea mays]AQK83612.1 Retrovirus-related Pol polyprotein LINE-1 [Zea mays]|eukprot:XP_008649297.1 autophagy-related protein 2 isoform X1 [Zea mays]
MGFLDGFRPDTLLKRVCKSLLKKRLGDLILGDLDLDQFDIQLGHGTLQLNDLALNAEFINRKLSGSPITLKEGSIKSLLVRFAASCEIVVEELELVLSPSVASEVDDVHTECSVSGSTSDTHTLVKIQRNESDSNQCSTSVSRDVDDGVKRIANAVKRFLTSFNIKLKNAYVIFDPQTSLSSRFPETSRSLVFRIKELEFGTQLGLFKLDNFLTFREAVIEFLKMDDVDTLLQNDLNRGTADISAHHSTTAVLTGPIGGFSGKLNLSIPWNKGCLSFEKIDADVSVDSLELRLQFSSIRWIMNVWDSLQRKPVDEQSCVHNIADISISASSSAYCPPASSSLKPCSDSVIASDYMAQSTFSQNRQDKVQDSFLTSAHVITDWMEPVARKDLCDPDSDCDESIDQFFECFEELRNSQSSLGNSGIWDWTCSVFNAISFASTLASGSDQVPKEPVVERTLRASITEISVLLLFSDDTDIKNSSVPISALDDMRHSEMFSSCLSSEHFEKSIISPATASSLNMHHLKAKCENIHLDLQTYPKNVRLKASIAQIKLDEYYHAGNNISDDSNLGNHFLNNNLRQGVQASLPQCLFAVGDHSVETYEFCGNSSTELTRVELLKTFGECTFCYDVSTKDQDGNLVSSTSMSIYLAPLLLWVHFHTIYMLLSFVSNVESDLSHGEHKIQKHGDEKGSRLTTSTTMSSSGSLKVQISLAQARIVLCFPSEFSWDLSHPSVLDKFLVIDHTSCLNMVETASHPQNEMQNEVHLSKSCTSIHLAVGDIDVYLVKPVNNVLVGRICSSSRQTFSAMKILSVTGSSYNDSGITLIRRKYPVTGPEILNNAWSLPKMHDEKITKNQNSKWAGISPSSNDLLETGSSMRQELLKSTELLFHVQLSCVSLRLSKKDCELLNKLLDHVIKGISNEQTSISGNSKDQSVLINDTFIQTSVLFECSILEICTELNETVEVGPLLQAELKGSWNSVKLNVSKFCLFSCSNVGGLNNASFLWVNHGEGELWGSVSAKNDKIPGESKDFLIVACKDSACRRGDGEGTNVLSIGAAGCSVTHIRNPKLKENYTSVDVRSGTIVAPGGRMDWINAICLLFSSGSDRTEKSDDSNTPNSYQSGEPYSSSLFIELADVAVSYEPHFKHSTLSAGAADRKFFSCLLAASSFKLHNKSASASAATDFDIQLRDLGVLISQSSGSTNGTCSYGVDYLRQAGYTKVVQNTFIEASLRLDSSFWKLEISDSQFDIGTCHDTTYGLIGLGSQLQQLYGPDMQDALDHLQSRWNSVQQANKQNMAADASDKSESSLEILVDSGDYQSDGLLDDIIENAFNTEDCMDTNFWENNYHHLFSSSETDDGFELNAATSHVFPISTPEGNVTQISLEQNVCPDQIIDSYCVPEFHQSLSTLCDEEHKCTSGDNSHRTLESEDAGWYNNVPLTIVENHVLKKKNEQVLQHKVSSVCSLNPDEYCNLKGKVHIHDIDVKWRMYAGDDWLLPQKDLTSLTCTDGRNRSSSLEFTVRGLNIQVDMYPNGDVSISRLSVAAEDITLCDQSIHAPWKLVLGCYNSKDYPRESCSSAFRLELESVRPEPQAPLEDYRLHLEILPLQLHLDQEQLNFLINFFKNDSCNNDPHLHCENDTVDVKSTSNGSNMVVDEALLPFFQKFDVKPLILHINYIPRQFDPIALSKGNYAELLNILPWKGIDLKLKHVSAMGIYGWNSIGDTVAAEWLEDISKNQVHKLLKGLPPIRSLVAVGSGTRKLVSLPIKSYKKDRKLLKGMQRGAVAFIRSVTIEAVGLGVHLAAGAHDMLVKTECALTTVPPPLASCEVKRTKHNIRANQPESAQQGMKQAYESLTDGFGRTSSAIIGNPIKVYNRGAGVGSVLATAICGAPAAAVAPISASARALHYALLGLRNSLDPEHKKESMYKYQGPSQA